MDTLMSAGEIRRRLGRSKSGFQKLVTEGTIPRPIVVAGTGRHVWPEAAWPDIEEAVRTRVDRRRTWRRENVGA